MKGEYITIIIFAVILAVSLLLIMIYREKIFKRKQQDKKDSLLQGSGFYSDPITLPCTNNTGKCTDASTQKTIFKCIPNPSTGKGCIDEKGHMTYDSKIVEKPCRQQCQGSLFTVQDGVDYKNININGQENQLLQGIGCNKVANIKNGLDETDFFIGDFDTTSLKYKLKNCIPDDYQGYYVKTYTCNDYDTTGANNCRYTCGQDGSIKLNGLFDTKLSKNVLMYYPIEYDQEDTKRHVCYDINDVNQIEILNSVAEVPNDFYYPNICYKHVNNYDIEDNLINLYPSGTSNVMTTSLNYNTKQEKYNFFRNFNNVITNIPNLLTTDYDYYYDYKNYIKIQLNNEIMLINKIRVNLSGDYIFPNTGDNFNNDKIIMYINTGDNNLYNNIDFVGYYDQSGTINVINYFPDQLYQLDNLVNKNKNINQYIPINLAQMLDTEVGPVDISFGLSTTTFSDNDNSLSIGEFIYYRGEKDNYNNGKLLTIIDTGTSTATVEGIISNIEQKIYWRKLKNKINNNTIDFIIERASDNNLITLNIDINNVLLTNNIFLKNGQSYGRTSELMVTRNIDTLYYYNNDAFFLFSKEVEKPGVKSIINGFFYPLYLKKFTYASTIQNNGLSIYTTTDTVNINRQDKVLLNNIQEKPFYVSSVVNGVPVYYYPVYLTNTIYSEYVKFPLFNNITLYVPKNAYLGVTEKPEEYLNYLNFDQYASLAMVYQDGSDYNYPVFLTNFFEDVHEHTFEDYKDITFYMANSSSNHALDSPPLKEYKLTDFKDLFEIGTVNTNLNTYSIPNLSFIIPNNAQINQELFLENFNSVNGNTDIQLYQNGTNIASIIYNTKTSTSDIISVFRNNDFLLNNVSGDSVFAQKSRLYNKILETQNRKSVNNNSSFDTIINPEKKLLIDADFKLFQSPYIENPDGTTINICYDEYNKPLAEGTQVTLNSPSKGGNNNNKIVINVPCSDYNTDIGASCGVFGLSIGSQPCQQERETSSYIIKEDTQGINLNNDYFNEYDYMESGLDIVENKMVCLDKFRTPYNDKSDTKCFPTYFTRENESGKIYAPGEEVYLTRYKRDYYLSTVNDNSGYPLNPLYWDRIYISTPDSEVANYQTFLYNNKDSLNNYTFRINQSGVTGLDPTTLAIQPIFRKNIAPYHNYDEFVSGSAWWNVGNTFAKNLNIPYDTISPTFKYNNIGVSLGGNNVSSFANPELDTIINQVFVITYEDKTISEMNLQPGDIFQTGFSFFNSLIYRIVQGYFQKGEQEFSSGSEFRITSTINNNFYDLQQNIISCDNINSNFKIGDYLVVYPDVLDFFDFYGQVIDNNVNTLYNPTFEIILIEDIDINNKKLTVKRNILNLNFKNYFYVPLTKNILSVSYIAFIISDKLIDLNFPITKISDNKLTFEVNFNISFAFTQKYSNTPFLFDQENELALTPFVTANYIKKSVTTPNARFDNINLYLSSLPKNAKTISALLDLRVVSSNNQTFLYINEFRNSRYTTEDTFITSFQTGDTIDLELPNGNILGLRVIRTNIFYQDDDFDKRYDYYCLLTSGTISDINNTNLASYTNIKGEYFLSYYFYGNIDSAKYWYYKNQILKTVRPGNKNIICDVYKNDTIWNTNFPVNVLSDIGFFPLENKDFVNITSARSNPYLLQSKILSEGNNIAYLKLSGTTFSSSKGTISINNIKTLGKAEGIVYYPKSDIENDTPNRQGFGSIISFQINEVNIVPSIAEGDIFVSRNNYILRATTKSIAGYDYVDGAISNKNSITNYDINELYSEKDIVEFVNPNQRIYFNNNTGESSFFNQNTWQVKAESRYNESSVIDFATNESYLKDTVVRFENSLWKALNDISPGISLPNITNANWQEITLTELDLFSNQNNFFTFSNGGVCITNEQLTEFNEYNINNYPLCVNDYETQTNYCPQPTVKFTESAPDYSNSFITVLPGASALASIMGQAFLTHNDEDYLSLPAVPYNVENYTNAQYLKDSGDISSADNLAQYIYQIPILNNLQEGKPFCTNTWLDSGVSDITFANSIVFFMLPLGIDSQDYPSFDVSQNGTILTKNIFSSRNDTFFGMSMITFKNNTPVFVDIGTSDATYIIDNYDSGVKVNDKLNLTKIGGGSSVTVTINKIGGYPIEPSRVTNRGTNYKLGDIWYYTNPDDIITSYGYLQPESDGGISARNFFSYYTDFNSQFNSTKANKLTIISKEGKNFQYDWVNNKYTEIIYYTISDAINFIPGDYKADQDNILEIHIADNGQGAPLQPNQYLVGSSIPPGSLTDGVSVYQVFNQDSFKCRMYGMFGTDYVSKIGYRLDDNLINNLNQENPGLIFNNFSPDIFSNSAICVGVVSEDSSKPDYISQLYNVFNLRSNDGTSSNITLLANNFSKKTGNADAIPLSGAYDENKDLREFNIVNTTDLHDFFSVPYAGTSNIYMGPVNEILPVLDTEPNNNVIKFSAIRQSRGRQNIGTSFDCNFYFKPQSIITTYPGGGTYTLTQKNNIIYYNFSENGSGALTKTNGLTIKNNREYVINLTDSSMDNFPLTFSLSSGPAFANKIIEDESTVINNGTLNVFYYINNASIDYSDYIKNIFYKQNKVQRNIKFYYDTKLANMDPTSLTIYMGFGFNQLFNNNLVITNNQ